VLTRKGGAPERLGGIGARVAAGLEELTGKQSRTVVLGHLLRGGSPTAFDRVLGLRFGAAAVRALVDGADGVMVALNPPTVDYVPLAEATRRMKKVPLDCDAMLTAREIGVNFGDRMPRCRRSRIPPRWKRASSTFSSRRFPFHALLPNSQPSSGGLAGPPAASDAVINPGCGGCAAAEVWRDRGQCCW